MVDNDRITLKNLNLFESLCNKIACLVYSRTDGDKKILNQTLDALNSLDFNLFAIKKERGGLLINQCCYIISSDDVHLTSKVINLFTNLLNKGQVPVEGKTLSLTISWCLECLKFGNEVNILKCLQALIKGNGKKIEEHFHQILFDTKKITSNFTFSSDSEDICLNCLRCIEAITVSTEDGTEMLVEENILKTFDIFKEILFKEKCNSIKDEITYCKFLITAMRGIGNVIQISNQVVHNELSNILGIVKGYMLYGLPDHDNYKVQKVFPTSITVPEVLKSSSQCVRKLRGKYDRRSKKVAVTSITSIEEVDEKCVNTDYVGYSEKTQQPESVSLYKTSDSDFSDGELNQNSKLKSYEGKVRHCALILLGTLIQKTDPKIFIAYMPSFLPDSSEFQHIKTLVTCLLNDPSPKCRSEVLGVILTIISNSRQYFQQADGLSKSSFIAFSYNISNIIMQLHKCLLLNLNSEKNNTIIKRTLKCISDLIRCSPYHKMKSGLIGNIAKQVKDFLNHKDVNVQIFALTIFGCIVSIEPKVQEVRDIIINSLENDFNSIKEDNNTSRLTDTESVVDFEFYDDDDLDTVRVKPWLFEQCLKNLTKNDQLCDSSTNAALQIESLQVIGALVRNFFRETIVSFPNEVIHLLKHCVNKTEYSIRLYSGKLMETVFNSLQYSFRHEDESERPSITLVTQFWEDLLPGPIMTLIQSQEEPMLRCTGCDCIANVGIQIQNGPTHTVQNSMIFDQLSRDKQIMCITSLFECVRDESPAVRSSAARALAIFVLFPSLREDSLFFLDAVDTAVITAKDEHNTVRTQASWLLGNLSEAIVLNRQNNIDDGVSIDIMTRLIRTGIELASDSPKIKPGAVRGLGNLLQVVNEELMIEYKETVVDGIDALIKNATSGTFMKARWNSCYAIANLLQNPLIHSNNDWTSKIFNVMTSLVQHYKNFKVRISAGFVLGIPPTRDSYGDLYNYVWSSVLNALENSKNISDFNEYQHRDQLVDQLCLVMCHLVSVVNPSDLKSLQDVLYFHLDNLTHFMKKFQERIVPEKSNVLLNATEKIHLLMDKKNLSIEEKSVLRVLDNLFDSDS